MDETAPNYHREYLTSPHHAALGLLTLGLGFMSGMMLPLIGGATVYVLGWIYFPDLPLFRRWVDHRHDSAKRAEEAAKVAQFMAKRESLLASLSPERRERYARLAAVCRDIEGASADNLLASADPTTDPRLRKLDELMWTYLRLLGIEESLERFLETERSENVPDLLKDAEAEATRLSAEIDALKAKNATDQLDSKQRYLSSRLERLDVLRKRQQRTQQAESNLALVCSEQERLEQQIKLIRADAVATKNAETLTARIDATVEHLDQTNKWLSELDEFKDLVGDMPNTELRVGYEAAAASPAAPPPVIQPAQMRRPQPQRQRIR
jgi:transcription elongation GreA/GreB family factor